MADLPPIPELLTIPRGRGRAVAPSELPPELALTGTPVLHAVLDQVARRTADRAWSVLFEKLGLRVRDVELRARRADDLEAERTMLEGRVAALQQLKEQADQRAREQEVRAESLLARVEGLKQTTERQRKRLLDLQDADERVKVAETLRDDALAEAQGRLDDLLATAEHEAEARVRWLHLLQEAHELLGHDDGTVRTCSERWCRRASRALAAVPPTLERFEQFELGAWWDAEHSRATADL